MIVVDQPARVFQVWAYTVGMGRLLLRSPKTDGCRTRIDVLFQNVKALKLSAELPGLTVSIADEHQQRRISEATGLLQDDNTTFFVLTGASYDAYVVAGAYAQVEDEGEYFEPSDLWTER